MTPVALSRPASLSLPDGWLRPRLRRLLRLLAGRDGTQMPDDMEDWQLRDLALTRPHAGPCHSFFFWLP